MMRVILLLLIGSSVIRFVVLGLNDDLSRKLKKGLKRAEEAIALISSEWRVEDYPNFLKSCFMHKVSWELLKLRFQKKIVAAAHFSRTEPFVISFSGSSVTAGHDSLFNESTPVQTGLIMKPVLAMLDVDLDSRNVALGNNPCTPYDVCVKYFAGLDADIVHWEQSYFCEGKPIVEQFVRQASLMPSKPIVVFSESQTGNWRTDDCKPAPPPHKVSDKEQKLLEVLAMNPVHLVSELNKDEFHRAWGFLAGYSHLYKAAGIQTFTHLKHNVYKCQGPYIPTWGEGAASWHPSVLGHRLRASHHAYFWLLVWRDALKSLQSLVSHRQADAILKDIEHHLAKLQEPVNPPKHASVFPDGAQCFTDYEPRSERDYSSLKKKVLQGLGHDPTTASVAHVGVGWNFTIYEDLVDKKLVQNSHKNGYLDFKWMLYGSKESGPIHFNLTLTKPSPVFLCETPGIWGKLPKGFDHIWKPLVNVYVTHNVDSMATFSFSPDSATSYQFSYQRDYEICATIRNRGQPRVKAGSHVLTLVPNSKIKAILAWIVTGG